jgi:hypothetical protein
MYPHIVYPDKTVNDFVLNKLCRGDKLLYKYYQDVNVQKFRKRLVRVGVTDDDVKTFIQTFITDAIRDVVYKVIAILTVHMKKYGDLIISGGEAINMYLQTENRIMTTDIDTKFTPFSPDSQKFFGYLQLAKLKLWNKLGNICTMYNNIIVSRIKKVLSPVVKLFGVSFSSHSLNRRYTLIKKNKEQGTLIDIEVFAIDLKTKYFVPSERRVSVQNIGGVLDIAFMRPKEFGYEASYTKGKGVYISSPITGNHVYNRSIHVASPKFLFEDIHALQKYNLRPSKKEKDRKRLYSFARYVLKVQNISPKDSIDTIFNKGKTRARGYDTSDVRPTVSASEVASVLRLDPYRYESVTTRPEKEKVLKQLFYGIKAGTGVNVPGYYRTLSDYRFDTKKGVWVKNSDPMYVHNEATHRPLAIKNFPVVPLEETLYGYNPVRDSWMPKVLVRKAAMIPLVGLKIKTAK